jgi:hypothetical protein
VDLLRRPEAMSVTACVAEMTSRTGRSASGASACANSCRRAGAVQAPFMVIPVIPTRTSSHWSSSPRSPRCIFTWKAGRQISASARWRSTGRCLLPIVAVATRSER